MNDSIIQSNVKINFTKSNDRKSKFKLKPKNSISATTTATTTVEKKHPRVSLESSAKAHDAVRIIPLGGLEQVGGNMMLIEYKNDIIVIDAGMLFPGGEMFGIDYVIPDIAYLKAKKDKIRGILITHGHLDHIGALKHVLPDLGFPPVYSTMLTIMMIKKSLEEAKLLKDFKFQIVNPDMDILKLGCFTVELFRVNHNIPESVGFAVSTPKGTIVNTGDYKIDFTPAVDKPADLAKIARIGKEGVRLMMGESTNSTKSGKTPSEKIIGESLDNIIKSSNQRLILTTFASNVGRIIQIIESAVRYNKVIFLAGRSMVNIIDIVTQLGYLNVPKGLIRKISGEVDQIPDDRVIILCTGSQGEEFSALMRISKGEHQYVQIKPGDKILMSAVPIPGNEKAIISMINDLIKKGVEIVTNQDLDIHASGHGYQEDQKIMMSLLNPEYAAPIHGELFMRDANKKLALELGMPEENAILMMENGCIIEMTDEKVKLSDKKIKLDTVMIDGFGMGHLSGEYVMKARKIMSEDGVLSLIFKIDTKSKDLVGNIQIESRGFVYSSEVKKIHTDVVDFVKKKYYEHLSKTKDIKQILKNIKDELSTFIEKTVGRVPMLMPMFVYINRDPKGGVDTNDEESIVGMTLEEQGYDS